MPKISAKTLEQHRAETIDRLLDAFGELVLTRGYADVSLADVAQRAGLARTAIYNYFSDREALLFAYTDREVMRAIEELHREVLTAATAAERLRIFVGRQLAGFEARHLPPDRAIMQFLKPETYERFMQHIEPVERIAHEIVTGGVESGEFVDVDPDAVVPLIMACVAAERVPIATRAHAVEDATEQVTTFLLRALGSPAS